MGFLKSKENLKNRSSVGRIFFLNDIMENCQVPTLRVTNKRCIKSKTSSTCTFISDKNQLNIKRKIRNTEKKESTSDSVLNRAFKICM